ncbi:cytoskeleton-associated protein 2-like isoform X1 [Eublepharis macularius]|uniref:Cytoskeleton-associated protein 2-like isoform X1 n=1 Tax=Eublepharis macularius TaxID=481883 RepID=A0AA97KEQ3_EUBMA|nr:cytoskeleton-associated protein 2-like isoform X1 [Eublepharis macularius]
MKPPGREGAASSAQEERWRKLQEYLATKGKQKNPSSKPYLKDNQQNLVPSKSDPTARCKKNITLNQTKGAQKRETKYSVPAGHVAQSKSSRAPVSRKPQRVPSELPKKGPPLPLPSKASAKNPSEKLSTTISSSEHCLCKVRKTKKFKPVTEPKTQALLGTTKKLVLQNCPAETFQEKADKENFGTKVDLSLEEAVAPRLGLSTRPQRVNSRPNVGFASRGNVPVKRQAHTYQAAKLQGQGKPRGPSSNLKGAHLQQRIPGMSGEQTALTFGQSSTYSTPQVQSQGLNPRLMKQCTKNEQAAGILGQGKENATQLRTCKAPDVQRGQLKPQRVTPCKAQHTRNSVALTSFSATELKRKRTLPLAAHDVNKHGSTVRRNQENKKLQREPRIPNSRPVVSTVCTTNKVVDSLGCEISKPRPLGMGMGQEPKTPCTQDRRKLLEQWLKSQGKSYKRPSMTLPAAKPRKKKESLNLSFWNSLGEEEERTEHSLVDKISSILMECLKLAEEGFPSEEILATLSQIPEVEKFAQFWICKAKLLARHGTFDVVGLYEAAVRAGAVPLQKLKEVVVDLLKNPDKTAQVIPTQVSSHCARKQQVQMTPQSHLQRLSCKPVSGIKLQVVPLLREKEHCTVSDTKLLTPVRRSLRIEGAVARYPQMLKDHDVVVTSLNELTATDNGSLFVFRKNEALLEDVETELLRL